LGGGRHPAPHPGQNFGPAYITTKPQKTSVKKEEILMTEPSGENYYRQVIYKKLQERETEDLIEIWQANDQEAWRPEAFQVIENILIERLGELPERLPPQTDTNLLEDDEEQNTDFPTDIKLIRLADFGNLLSKIIVLVAIIYTLVKLINYFFIQVPPFRWQSFGFFQLIITFFQSIDSVLNALFVYVILQTLCEVIYLLLDIRDLADLGGEQNKALE
jgi:hypothetical protein